MSKTSGDRTLPCWAIPESGTGGDYKVKINDTVDPATQDYSDMTFEISAPRIEVRATGAGDRWAAEIPYTILWDATDLGPSVVKIELTRRDNNIVTTTITASTPNTGSYSWMIPSWLVPGSDYRLKITSVLYPHAFGHE